MPENLIYNVKRLTVTKKNYKMKRCYVSTYGYEITNSKGEKSTYADALWIDTVLPISQIERYIEKSGVAEPSNISFVGDSDECGNYKVWIIAQEENNPHIIELTDRKKIDHMIILYWD